MNQKEAKALVKKCGSQNKAAKEAGINRSQFQNLLAGKIKVAHKTVPYKKTPKESVDQAGKRARTLADFRATYDKDTIVPSKIKAALKSLGNSWEYESEFVKRAAISFADMATYRELFESNVIHIRQDSKRVWAGTVSLAKQMREMI